jgi:hypothetical protein
MAEKSVKRIEFQMRIKEASINLTDGAELIVMWVRGKDISFVYLIFN